MELYEPRLVRSLCPAELKREDLRSLAEFDFGGALPALIVRGFGDAGDVRMVAQVFA